MTAKHALASSLILITLIALGIFVRQLSSRSYPATWLRRHFQVLWSKQLIFFLVLFEAGLLLTSALPVLHEAKNKSEFTNYIAFSFPCLAGLVAGGGFFFDAKKRLTKEVNAFFASAVLIGIGYVVCIAATPFAASVALWGCLQATGSVSVALACLLVTRKHFRFASDGLFLPSVILLGFFSTIVGLAFYLTVGSAQTP